MCGDRHYYTVKINEESHQTLRRHYVDAFCDSQTFYELWSLVQNGQIELNGHLGNILAKNHVNI